MTARWISNRDRCGNPNSWRRLRVEVCRTAEEALAGTGRHTSGCPYLEYWFHHYAGQAASHIEKALLRYAPAAAGASSAQEYIAIAAERARMAVVKWVRTGEIDAPKEAMTAAPGTRVQFKAGPGGPRQPESPAAVRQQLGAGTSLPADVRGRMESVFGHDFSRVRVHADAGAHRLATGLNAHAFTIGGDVAFAAGTYRPGTPAGDALIAHELAHVVQQAGALPESGFTQVSGAEYRTLEDDADRAAARAVASLWSGAKTVAREALPRIRSGLSLQRCSSKPDKESPKDDKAGPEKCDRSKDNIPRRLIPVKPLAFDCSNPTKAGYDEISAAAGNEVLGFTQSFKAAPEVSFSGPDPNGYCKLQWLQRPKPELAKYAFMRADTYDMGVGFATAAPCTGKTMPIKLQVEKETSQWAEAAEREHCEDFKLAYAKTFGRLEQFYDELTSPFCENDPAAPHRNSSDLCDKEKERRFELRMGFPFNEFEVRKDCLIGATLQRDRKKWHTAHATATYPKGCSEELRIHDLTLLKDVKTAAADPHPTATIVNEESEDVKTCIKNGGRIP